ncbi:ribose 5-phosphate isomerase B [Aminicella lysinilytica]|mgnify:CR=1 FL=1|uniref:ribose 5-phosphate isomerase B n=1 Tax=Aminicella lysinilytica TaxID=433323 RepID=UPI001800ABE5|nr:ribose 5-phosphate isomerase B [Aminicella lysinilytica]NLD11774.1 ribose 5-phosphate isomerase B [Clostridiales bacterium]
MIIAVASDHGGFKLKQAVKKHLIDRGYQIVDLGTTSEESVDYPIYGKVCADAVAAGKAPLGMVFCGTGIGISIAANKVHGIRCANCTSVEMAHLAKQHNNANMLAMGGRITDEKLAIKITDEWLDTEFESGGRHSRRVDMLNEM